ncbi:MAG TPA: mandelate racemase/muconate lactonizing enzyme family protein [Candidatus Limnocylindria bacterium]|nr:mandelate racemase/muconate lactonizing enzyme family protein [Candidatus Limnocylindria bacterium]
MNFLKIAKLATHVLEGKAERAIQFGAGSYGTFTATLVEITTDDGITGVGECIARRAPRVVDTVVRDLLWPVIEGRDPRDVAGLWDGMFARLRPWGHDRGFVHEGISGVDQALWDILAQAEGVPLYKALRGAGRDRVPVYGSKVYTADLPAMAREAEAAVKRGHKALKVQLGRSAELGGPNADVEVCRVIREAIGPDIEMGADVNSAYDAGTAIRVCERIAKYDLWFLEEPVFPDDLDGYERIRRVSSVPLACGESEFGTFGFRELFRRGLIDIAQPDVARVGGFTAALRVGALVQAHNLRYAPHTGFSCGVAQVASLHLSAAVPNLSRCEWMWIDNPLAEIFEEPLPQPKDGAIAMPTKPGLGLRLDRKKLERFRID